MPAPDKPAIPAIPEGEHNKRWVWYSTLASREADKVSVLACVETTLAVALYWWLAIRFNTHLHLIISVVIAPLLLLRSPESMKSGVMWFFEDWFKFKTFNEWKSSKTALWIIGIILASGLNAYHFSHALKYHWFVGTGGLHLLGWSLVIGALTWALAFAFAHFVTTVSAVSDAAVAETFIMLVLISALVGITAGAGFLALIGVFAFYLVFTQQVRYVSGSLGIAAGAFFRALVCRVFATARHPIRGLMRLPENWHENNFLIDSFLPSELLPGIRRIDKNFALEEFIRRLREDKSLNNPFFPLHVALLFTPALLYRLNIKATAWFWWPLVFLLKPTPMGDEEGRQKQALCWPWTNPFQKLWIGFSALLVLFSVISHNLDEKSWTTVRAISSLPLPMKVFFAVDWQHIRIWHWMQWITATTGLGMLWHAGNARSQDVNGNWQDYSRHWKWNIRLLTGLWRMRTLSTITTLLLAVGALLLQYRTSWQNQISVPPTWIKVMEEFYEPRSNAIKQLPGS